MSSCCQKKLVYFNMVHHPIKDRLLSRLCRSLSLSLLLPHIDLITKQNMPVFFFFFGIHWNILLRTKPFLVFYRSSQWPTQGSGCSLKGMYPHLSFLQWLEMPNPGHYDPPSQKKCYEPYVITLISPPPTPRSLWWWVKCWGHISLTSGLPSFFKLSNTFTLFWFNRDRRTN